MSNRSFDRDYIRAGLCIDEIFPEHDIRLISVGEGMDTAEGENEFIAFINIMNEHYSRDISKKRKLCHIFLLPRRSDYAD